MCIYKHTYMYISYNIYPIYKIFLYLYLYKDIGNTIYIIYDSSVSLEVLTYTNFNYSGGRDALNECAHPLPCLLLQL